MSLAQLHLEPFDHFKDTDNCPIQYNLFKQFFDSHQPKDSQIEELHLLTEQNKVLKTIQEEMEKKKRIYTEIDLDDSINLSSTTLSFRPQLAMPLRRTSDYNSFWQCKNDRPSTNTTLDDDIKMKRSCIMRIISEAQIQKALNEIEQRCQISTTQVIRHLVNRSSEISKKLRQSQKISSSFQKSKKLCHQLKQMQLSLQKKVIESESKVRSLQQQISLIKQTTPRHRRSVLCEVNTEKQKQLQKLQVALILKQKLINQSMKKLNHKLNLIKREEDFIVKQRKTTQQMWEKIVSQLGSHGDEFKISTYNQCQESLTAMRYYLQESRNQVDSRHEEIKKIISHAQNAF